MAAGSGTTTAGRAAVLPALAAAVVLAGCASTQLEAQWSDKTLVGGTSLAGQRVLVACEAAELVLKQLCEEHMAQEVVARGATPVLVEELVNPTGDAYLPAARGTGAAAVLVVQVSPAGARVSGPVSIGLGGFGFGGGGFAGGIGVSVPVGGGQTTIGYAASARLIQAANGRVMWSGRASSPPSADASQQLRELSAAVLGGAAKSGFF
ncbi:MAG TPA: hypothetical protein VLA16_10160 [Ideonella sp.]|nr:hypothetical protein [Ideonella sp.]